ncbi:uncharacterized protein LOC108805816 [Raphanus sativus]|uniref:Uncharacterized protein LOC108805816 n=1 Tax=Raphanus sativus TaxID=3726 RepID=A0A6J0JCD8_RAPSA|nr:uncharacterized protein LOC108805816 [Raphanus sativus]
MDSGGKQLSMERVELPQLHEHPLIPFSRFAYTLCELCSSPDVCSSPTNDHLNRRAYVYGGYRCNELGCEEAVFHKDCASPLKEINHSFHPDHPLLELIIPTLPLKHSKTHTCFSCGDSFQVGYRCTICDFKLCLECARRSIPLVLPGNSYGHQHQLKLVCDDPPDDVEIEGGICKVCAESVDLKLLHFGCQDCKEFVIHVYCRETYHISHPQHPLKPLEGEVPHYADKECLLCKEEFDERYHQVHHCDVCNFSICGECMGNPPPVALECAKTHEHELHLVPRLLNFTCNACGTPGDRSPYFCLQCNFMIHRDCIDLPLVININRHDHRISYTPRLGHGHNWKCKVCRQKVDGFYGGYTCSKCPTFAVHARCATRKDVWDMVEREGTPEEEEIPPYEVIDANTIRHFSHDHHHLQFNKDGMMILPESTLCKACVFQIGAEPFYICKQQQCDFVLHEKCANLPRNKRHVCNNLPFTLHTDPHFKFMCWFCRQDSTGFRYESGSSVKIDVRCASISDSIEHESHPHPLYYSSSGKWCSRCGKGIINCFFICDECEGYMLDGKCALLPEKVMKSRYDDHPLFLSYGDMNADETYWCESCETKVYPKRGFYTCNDCGVVLHISCVFGDFSYIMPGSFVHLGYDFTCSFIKEGSATSSNGQVVSNNSSCRQLCFVCNSRCKLPSVLKLSMGEHVVYICSLECHHNF